MKQKEKIKFLLENGKNYPLSYWKEILFKEKEKFWQEFEQELRIERKTNKSDSFRLTLKMLKDWNREWVIEKEIGSGHFKQIICYDGKQKILNLLKRKENLIKVLNERPESVFEK